MNLYNVTIKIEIAAKSRDDAKEAIIAILERHVKDIEGWGIR